MDYIRTFEEADKYLGKKQQRPVGKTATVLRRNGDDIELVYHDTPVVTYHPTGSTTFNSGGHLTVTTKSRMNEFSLETITQEKGQWFFSDYKSGAHEPFVDGVTALPDGAGYVYPGGKPDTKEVAALIKAAKAYIKAFTKEFSEDKVGAPSDADCRYCYYKIDTDNGHLLTHIEESYFVPSLLYRAWEENRDGMSIIANHLMAQWAGDGDISYTEHTEWILEDAAKYALKKYLAKRLGFTL